MKTIRLFRHFSWILLFLPCILPAQQKPYSEEVTVVAPYQPVISDANKINLNPEIQDTSYPKPQFTYSIQSNPYPTTFTPEPIEAAKMAGEPINKLYENMVKLGFGTYLTPYAEYFFNSTRSKTLAYGVHVKHLSSNGKIDHYAYPGYSNNELSIFAKQFNEKKYNLNATGGFKREVVHYYGFNPDNFDPAPAKNDIRQTFGLIHLKAGINSALQDSAQLAYNVQFSGYHLFDKYKSKETNLRLEGGIEKTQKLLEISKNQQWGMKAKIDFFNDQADGRKSGSRALIVLRPFLFAERGPLQLKVGFNTTIEADTTAYLHLYPEIELRARILPKWLSLFAGLTGYTERNSYKKFIAENPFVSPQLPLTFMNTKSKVYGGFNSNISNLFDVFLEISLSKVKNQYFYENIRTDSLENKFTIEYDDNCDIFELKSEVAWQLNKHINAMYRFHLHQYYTSGVLPWHISDYDMTLNVSYNLQDKILFDAGFIYYDRMYALYYGPTGLIEPIYLRDRTDLNLGIEYRYNRMISAFLHLNNLASISYFYWKNYPSQKFNLLAGVTLSF